MYKNILLPTDGLGKCKFGTCHGILLAKDLGAKVTAVCVTAKLSGQEILKIYNPDLLFGASDAKVAKESMKRADDLHKEFAEKALEVAEKMCAANGVKCEKVYLAGETPTDGILKVAKDKNCDLIFISTHGNPGLMDTLFGNVVTKILSRSKTPVLVHHCGGPS
jgi:nucleotide-binding universal stress UspA family protein